MEKSLLGRVALVTGASRGIGRATALALADAGAHVIAAARTVGGLEELDDAIKSRGGSATLVPIDLKDLDAVARFAPAIEQRWTKLDILVGNAGVLGPLSPVPSIDLKTFEDVFRVNVTANFRLLQTLDPLLKLSDAGRVVMVSSSAARSARAYWGAYAASKAALEAMVRSYAKEVANISPVRAMLFNPGATRTAMRAAAMPGEDPASLPSPEAVAPHIVALCGPKSQATGKIYDFPTRSIVGFDDPA
jgi:NAD(P)-dependent dehydrogenase (short-subunit alcohol dehydrogenase family)